MAVHVARLTERLYSVSHQYEQYGDVMMYPEVHFYVASSGEVFPCMFRQDGTGYRVESLREEDGQIVFRPRAQHDVASFVGLVRQHPAAAGHLGQSTSTTSAVTLSGAGPARARSTAR